MSEENFDEKSSKNTNKKSDLDEVKDEKRRKIITNAAYATAGVGVLCALYPFVDSMNPAEDVKALSSIEVDLSGIKIGEEKKVMWRGKPIFVKRRTKQEVTEAQNVELSELKDPQKDSDRVKKGKEEWLITIGICTHLGCVPIGGQGDFNGWFCPCHGSQYDSSGRIRKGPAPTNLAIPPYEFVAKNRIKIG